MKKLVFVIPLLLAASGFGQELLTNGDFEQDLSVGWTQYVGGNGTPVIQRVYDGGHDNYYACDSLYLGAGWSQLGQVVDVPGPGLVLSFRADYAIGGGSSSCWQVAAVVARYKDQMDNTLGETRYYYHNSYCTWVSTPTVHLIDVTNPTWTQYTLDVADEIETNLPGVNPGDVSRVEFALYDTTSGS